MQSSAGASRRVGRLFSVLPDECCVCILALLEQNEVFRAAPSCSALRCAAAAPELFPTLDLRAVGKSVTKRGRLQRLTQEATVVAVRSLLSQPRFREVLALDLRGVDMGSDGLEENRLLGTAARFCTRVCHLQLGGAEPRSMWTDLGRLLPAPFERSLRRWWPGRLLCVEGHDRWYEIQT